MAGNSHSLCRDDLKSHRISGTENLYKIGFSAVSVPGLIKHASKNPTYLTPTVGA